MDPNGREWPRLKILGSFLFLHPLLATELVVLLSGIPLFDNIQYILNAKYC